MAGQPVPGIDWRDHSVELARLAAEHGVEPLLWHVFKRSGVDAPATVWQRLAEASRQSAVRYLLAGTTLRAFEPAMRSAGVPVIWLKGVALAHSVYAQPTLRPMEDMDALVPFNQRKTALEVARSLGFHPIKPELFAGYDDLLHHYHLRGHLDDRITVELHYRLLGSAEELLPLAQQEWFWSQSQPCTYENLAFTMLRQEAHLLYLCAHAILQHGETDFSLRRYLDLHLLLKNAVSFDWDLVVQRAESFRWTYAVERALEITQEYFGTPLPQELIPHLRARRPSTEKVAYARRRQPTNDWELDLAQMGVLRWRDRLRLAFGLAFPSPAYMRWRYATQGGWSLAVCYVRRVMRMVPQGLQWLGKRLPASRGR